MDKLNQMIDGLNLWFKSVDYRYIECNYVPSYLFTRNEKANSIIRNIFRLLPFNIRIYNKHSVPFTPQTTVALLKAFSIVKNKEIIYKLYQRALNLRSCKTRYFALKQGIQISVSLYENTPEDPTPLNTVWFGQFLLDDESQVVKDPEKQNLLYSISNYLINELGYVDHGKDGVYFYYGPTLKKEIYNASALISAFLIKVGEKYNIAEFAELGRRGIRYIVHKQNFDGSWFYAGNPERPTIDCFHQSYILQALYSVKDNLDFDIAKTLKSGIEFYRKMFIRKGQYIRPQRYDKRYLPRNTWLFVDVDSRDVAEAIVFFSKYEYYPVMVNSLIDYLFDKFYRKNQGCFYPEIFIYGKNRIPYSEFQAWILYSLYLAKEYKYENSINISEFCK